MKTLLLQSFARLPEPETTEPSWIVPAAALLAVSSLATGLLLGITILRRRAHRAGYLEGFREAIKPQSGDLDFPARTIKISPRVSQLRPPTTSPFQVSREGDTARVFGYQDAKTEIK
jgi:hypothetical protein